MIILLDKIIFDYKLAVRGVIHIGAHHGQEYQSYVTHKIKNIIFFEPVISNYKKLLEALPEKKNIKTFNLALGNETGTKKMYIETANRGQSCSLLEPGTHLKMYPKIKFNNRETVKIDKLDNISFNRNLYNMINIDVQGYELEVFKGGKDTLKSIDIVYTEINLESVYKKCCLVEDIDTFLKSFGFIRVRTQISKKDSWGDALYLKYI